MANKRNWARAREMALENLREITPDEDARITADALSDPDAQPADGLLERAGKPQASRRGKMKDWQ